MFYAVSSCALGIFHHRDCGEKKAVQDSLPYAVQGYLKMHKMATSNRCPYL